MNAPLQTILRLYREPLPPGVPPALEAAEAEAPLAAVRDALDARPRARPDAATLDAILLAAAHGNAGAVAPGVRHDRAPAARQRLRRAWLLVGTLGALALALVVVRTNGDAPAPARAATAAAPTPTVAAPVAAAPETAALTLPPSVPPATVAPRATTPVAASPAPESPRADVAPAPEADPVAGLAALEARTQRLRARVDSTLWDEPGVSLALPSPGAPGRFSTASFPKD